MAKVDGTPGADRLVGTDGGDLVLGLGGADIIDGLGGDDDLRGGGGSDVITDDGGNDGLSGNGGRDRLIDCGGDDTYWGGGGRDSFVFSQGGEPGLPFADGTNWINDFVRGDDSLEVLATLDPDSNGDGRLDGRDDGVSVSSGDLTIEFGAGGDTVTLRDITRLGVDDWSYSG